MDEIDTPPVLPRGVELIEQLDKDNVIARATWTELTLSLPTFFIEQVELIALQWNMAPNYVLFYLSSMGQLAATKGVTPQECREWIERAPRPGTGEDPTMQRRLR